MRVTFGADIIRQSLMARNPSMMLRLGGGLAKGTEIAILEDNDIEIFCYERRMEEVMKQVSVTVLQYSSHLMCSPFQIMVKANMPGEAQYTLFLHFACTSHFMRQMICQLSQTKYYSQTNSMTRFR
jgi:hypothetical protein